MSERHLTREQLIGYIRDVTGPLVAELVGERMAKAEESIVQRIQAALEARGSGVAAGLVAAATGGAAPAPAIQREKGQAAGRYIRAVAAAKLEQAQGRIISPEDMLKRWGDGDLAEKILADRQKAMAATDATSGGFLVPTQFSTDLIELLRPASIVRRMGPMVIPMPMGSVRIPKITSGSTAYYQGENANATASQLAVGQIVLTFKKLTALVPISNDLLRYSAPAADSIVRDDVVRAIAQRENQAFLRDAGTESTPRGMRYWATTVTASAGTSLAQMTTDLGVCLLALLNANVPITRGAWLMSPRNWNSLMTIQNANGFFVFRDEMTRGTLWGYPFGVSTAVPGSSTTGELYFADMADAVIGEAQNLIVDASMEAAYVDSSSTLTSAYSQDQTVVRAITEHDFAMRRAESVTVISTMSW